VTVDWHYAASGGLAFPVQHGDVWQAGPHIIACGDLEAGDFSRLLRMHDVVPDLVYCDPPWNAGNAAAFRTKAGVARKVDFYDFLVTLCTCIAPTTRDVFLEMGKQQLPTLLAISEGMGATCLNTWPITYYRKHPCRLVHLRWNEDRHDLPQLPDFDGMDDDDTPLAALGACMRVDDVVADPCTGRGLTAVTVAKLGGRFVGLELSPFRMSCALHKLAQLGHTVTPHHGRLDS